VKIEAFQNAAAKTGLDPAAAMGGLQQFIRNAEDFKKRIGEVRNTLKDLGAGDIVERIAATTNNVDALRIAFERIKFLTAKKTRLDECAALC